MPVIRDLSVPYFSEIAWVACGFKTGAVFKIRGRFAHLAHVDFRNHASLFGLRLDVGWIEISDFADLMGQ